MRTPEEIIRIAQHTMDTSDIQSNDLYDHIMTIKNANLTDEEKEWGLKHLAIRLVIEELRLDI